MQKCAYDAYPSETYESKASALNGIESVKKHAPDAEIDDQT